MTVDDWLLSFSLNETKQIPKNVGLDVIGYAWRKFGLYFETNKTHLTRRQVVKCHFIRVPNLSQQSERSDALPGWRFSAR